MTVDRESDDRQIQSRLYSPYPLGRCDDANQDDVPTAGCDNLLNSVPSAAAGCQHGIDEKYHLIRTNLPQLLRILAPALGGLSLSRHPDLMNPPLALVRHHFQPC